MLVPLLAVAAVPLIERYLLWCIYLKPPTESWQLMSGYESKSAMAVAILIAGIPWIWFAGLRAEGTLAGIRMPWAVVLTGIILTSAAIILSTTRATWFLVEWTKVRTPNPSFARNTLFWEQRNFESVRSETSSKNVSLLGSSQTYQGFDLQLLKEICPGLSFEKNTLAGFGPMQYPFLLSRIRERNVDVIVCHLSEFDFYREDVLPTSRLRWASSIDGVTTVAGTLTGHQLWCNRSEFADLSAAAAMPFWRHRDHFRRAAFGYWWRISEPLPNGKADNSVARLADAPALKEAIGFLKKNVGHKKLVEANFRSFRSFATDVSDDDIRLIVLEGQVHPDARAEYDTDNLQQTTRTRLKKMSQTVGFDYFPGELMPRFAADDFADAYHLNELGRLKLSEFLASVLSTKDQ